MFETLDNAQIEDFAKGFATRYENWQTAWCFHRYPVLADQAARRQGLPHRCENRYNGRQIADQTLLYTGDRFAEASASWCEKGDRSVVFRSTTSV
jgi:hypothetical protein